MKELHQVFSRQIFPFLQVFLLLILFLPFNLVSQNILSDHIIISFSVFIVACLAAISIFMVTINKQILQVTITDILAAYYFVYILLNAYVIRPIPVPDILEIRYLLVVLIYLSVRIMTEQREKSWTNYHYGNRNIRGYFYYASSLWLTRKQTSAIQIHRFFF